MCNMMEHNWQFFDYRKGKSLVTFSFAPFVACFAFLVNGFAKMNLSPEAFIVVFFSTESCTKLFDFSSIYQYNIKDHAASMDVLNLALVHIVIYWHVS